MPETNNPETKELTDELYSHANQTGPKRFVLIIVIALLSGLIGGISGVYYTFNNPGLRQKLGLETEANKTPLNRTIVLSEESGVIDVVNKAKDAVVSIVVTKDLSKIPGYGNSPFNDDFFCQFFYCEPASGAQPEPNPQKIGAGSGFFVTADGLILTNKHVVSEADAAYTVITNDGKEYEAKVAAVDPRNDLAILKVEVSGAKYLELSDSSLIQIGQRVVAIGNSLGQYQNTVTTGVVSGIGRSITAGGSSGSERLEGVIQTDAAINPGNSGGPLLNSAAQVIGINTAVDMQGQLVGFAIPAKDAQKALDSFRKNGKIIQPFIGVRYIMVSKALAEREKLPKDYGALLVRGDSVTDFAVSPGSPADKAGLTENDIIFEVNGKELKGDITLAGILRDYDVGDTVTLKVFSPSTPLGTGKGEEKTVRVTLTEAK